MHRQEETMEKLSLLAVFAHPDDESCGPGGTLALYADRGVAVSLVCATQGEGGVCDDPECGDFNPISPDQVGIARLEELSDACKALGIPRWGVLGYPDSGLAQCDRRALEEEMVRWIRTVRPQVVVTCYPEGELGHPDHDTVARVATKAYRGAGRPGRFPDHMKQGLDPWQPSKLYYCIPPDPDLASQIDPRCPLTAVDVSAFTEVKINAMQCHQSQQECSQGFAEVVRNKPRWTESFLLAHSTIGPRNGPEDDLFAGVVKAERFGCVSERRAE